MFTKENIFFLGKLGEILRNTLAGSYQHWAVLPGCCPTLQFLCENEESIQKWHVISVRKIIISDNLIGLNCLVALLLPFLHPYGVFKSRKVYIAHTHRNLAHCIYCIVHKCC